MSTHTSLDRASAKSSRQKARDRGTQESYSEPLLQTKFFVPPVRPEVVSRTRLLARLGPTGPRALTLISAPPGYGKTTLISDWLKDSRQPCAWLALDAEDNDPVRFMTYLVAAWQRIDPSIGQAVLPLLRLPQLPPTERLATLLLNDLAAVAGPLTLVLEDYHSIHSAFIHALVEFLLQHAPAHVHLIITTRKDPPFSLSRLRVRGQMIEIRADDLRFTEEESTEWLITRMGLNLDAEAVSTLTTRTEGWVAGLQLAALSLQGQDAVRIADFVHSFSGSDRYVLDYLLDEVLQRQAEGVRAFLVQTSILDRLNCPLCNAVTGRADSRSLLTDLEEANLFLIPLDARREWYRYHHLFADLLRRELEAEKPEQIRVLHGRASRWYENNGDYSSAVKHALAALDWDLAADLVERVGMGMVARSQTARVRDWCAAFPEEVFRRRPALCLLDAWPRALSFRSDFRPIIEKRLQQAEQALASIPPNAQIELLENSAPVSLRQWCEAQAAAIRGELLLLPSMALDAPALIALSRQALELLPGADRFVRSLATINLAHARMALGDVQGAQDAFEQALRAALENSDYYGATTAVFYLARNAYWQGELERVAAICREKRQIFSGVFAHPEQELPAIRSLYVPLATVQLERNDLEAAEASLGQALDLMGWAPWIELVGYVTLARLEEARGRNAAALEAIGKLEKLGPDLAPCAAALRMRHQARTGEAEALREVKAWAETHMADWNRSRPVPGLGPFQCDVAYLTFFAWSEMQAIVGNPDLALAFVGPVLQDALEKGLNHRVIELSCVEAQVRMSQGDKPRVWEALERALTRAERAGYVRSLDRGPAFQRLLAEAADRGIAREYIRRLLALFGSSPGNPTLSSPNSQGLTEPISDRELEILRLIAEGKSNAEIARELVITIGTVKWHINHVLAKLGVTSRTQAIARARDLELV